MRRAAKVDRNQADIAAALRRAGWQVADTHRLGQGYPDLTVSKRGVTLLVECKMPGEKLTPDEVEFHDNWKAPIVIAYDAEFAVSECENELVVSA